MDLNTNQHCKYMMSFFARWINENLLKRLEYADKVMKGEIKAI